LRMQETGRIVVITAFVKVDHYTARLRR